MSPALEGLSSKTQSTTPLHPGADLATSDVDMLDTHVPDMPTKRPRPASPSKLDLAPQNIGRVLFSDEIYHPSSPGRDPRQSALITYASRPRIAASLDRDSMEVDEESEPAPSHPQATMTQDEEEEEEGEGESPSPRRFRPVFLDHK